VRQEVTSQFVDESKVDQTSGRTFAVDDSIWLADIHDVRGSNHLTSPETPFCLPRETVGKLEKGLWVGQTPGVDLASIGITAPGQTTMICTMHKAGKLRAVAVSKICLQTVDGSGQLGIVGERCQAILMKG
jgi:hypothetical protein